MIVWVKLESNLGAFTLTVLVNLTNVSKKCHVFFVFMLLVYLWGTLPGRAL